MTDMETAREVVDRAWQKWCDSEFNKRLRECVIDELAAALAKVREECAERLDAEATLAEMHRAGRTARTYQNAAALVRALSDGEKP